MVQEYQYRSKGLKEIAKAANSWMASMIGHGTLVTPYPGQTIMEEGDKGSFMCL